MTAPAPAEPGRSKSLIPVTLLAVGAVLGIALCLVVWWTLSREHARLIDDQQVRAQQSADIAHLLVRRQIERGRTLVRAVAASRAVQDALAADDRDALASALGAFGDVFSSDQLVIDNTSGRTLAWSSPIAVMAMGLARRKGEGPLPRFGLAGGDVAVFDARPIDREGKRVGGARIATVIGRVFLRDAATELGTPLALFQGEQTARHSTFPAPPPPPTPSPSSGNGRATLQVAELEGETFDIAYRAIDNVNGEGWIAAGQSRKPALAAYRRFALVVAGSATGVFVLTLLAVGVALGAVQQRERLQRQRDEARRDAAGLSDRIAHLTAVVHDIKAPLAGVQLRSEQLLEDGVEPPVARALDTIVDTCERLNLYLVNVLTAAQAEEGPIAIRREVVLVPGLVDDIAERLSPLAGRRHITLATSAPVDVPPVSGDPVLLERVLWNLGANAIAATPDGGRVTLFAERAGAQLRLGTRDTGSGFTKFAPGDAFTRGGPLRLHASLRAGSGLGLFIVKRIAEAHGGTALASNVEGGGAEVAIEIPLA